MELKSDILITNLICKDIFKYIEKRKDLKNKILNLNIEVDELSNLLEDLDKPFYNLEIDIEKYKLFFKTYDIFIEDSMYKDKGVIYHCKEINLFQNQHEKFWEVEYDTIGLNYLNFIQDKGVKISLRKYLHKLTNPGVKLIPIKNN